MIDWLKNLEPEFLIIFGGLLLLVIVNASIFMKSTRTLNLIGKRALRLSEDLVIRRETKVVDILISNTSFISVKVAAVGYIFKKNLIPISEDVTEIAPRDSLKISMEIDALEAVIYNKGKKLSRLKIYVEDTLGRRSTHRAKDSYRTLKKMAKDRRKAAKNAAKKQRFETGKYNFIERVGLVFKFLFSPVYKLNYMIKRGLNKRLKEREVRLIMNHKEREHSAFLKSISEEDRRERELMELEDKIAKERKEMIKQQQVKQQIFLEEKKKLEAIKVKLEEQKIREEKEKYQEKMLEKEEILVEEKTINLGEKPDKTPQIDKNKQEETAKKDEKNTEKAKVKASLKSENKQNKEEKATVKKVETPKKK